MCARFTVLSDTPIAAAIAGCVIPLSRNSTIWMRWRCGADIFHRNAVFRRRTSALLHLSICFPRIRWRKRITPRGRKTLAKPPDSSRYGGGIRYVLFPISPGRTVAALAERDEPYSNILFTAPSIRRIGRFEFESCHPEDAVSCEPVFARNFLLTGKFTGNFAGIEPAPWDFHVKSPANSMVSGRIPYATEQGIFGRVSGKIFRRTANLQS